MVRRLGELGWTEGRNVVLEYRFEEGSIDRAAEAAAKGLEPPAYTKRPPAPSLVDRFEPYLRERLAAYPDLTARRLLREIKERMLNVEAIEG